MGVHGYVTLDCRDGRHAGCAVCDCECHGEPSAADQALRERIKLAIQTAQDQEGRLLYVIPPGVAGLYADAVMRVLSCHAST